MTASVDSLSTTSHTFAPLGTGALLAGFTGTLLGLAAAALDSQWAAFFFLWGATGGLLGLYTPILEKEMKHPWLYEALSLALLLGNYGIDRFAFGAHPSNFVFLVIPFVIVALVAPILAWLVLRNGILVKGISPLTYLLTIWLVPLVLFTLISVAAVVIEHETFHASVSLGFSLGLPFGPWATQVARLTSFPNAGEFFSWPTALLLTALLAALVYCTLRRTRLAAYCLLPYAWLLIGWYAIGFGQLMNCLE